LSHSFDRLHWGWSALTGLLLSLAYLTRYAGASLFITALLVIVFMRPMQSVKRAVILLSGALLPILTWMLYGQFTGGTGSFGNRQLLWHPLSLDTFFEALKNLLTWIAPNDLLAASSLWGRSLSLISLLLLPSMAVWLGWAVWRRIKTAKHKQEPGGDLALAFTHGLHILVYVGFLVISLTFFDASTPLNDRILSVIYIPEIILFSSAMGWLWNWLNGRLAVFRWILIVFCLLLMLFSVKDGYAVVNQLGREGQGFAHRGISDSPAIKNIRGMPPIVIYSNKPGAIFLLTGKAAYVTPTPMDPVSGQARSNFNEDLVKMQQRVRDGEAILVLFGLRNSQDPDEMNLFDTLSDDLRILADYGDILIFGISP
jgi:hypothetical protein